MGTPQSPTCIISSVYGWRSWNTSSREPLHRHNGIDIVANPPGLNEGRRVNSPFEATVVHVFPNVGWGGHGIILRYICEDTETHYYVRYFHLQSAPTTLTDDDEVVILNATTNNSVRPGSQVGFMGGTDGVNAQGALRTVGVHLHMDVHVGAEPESGFPSHSVDPRAFFPYGFVDPWPSLNARIRR